MSFLEHSQKIAGHAHVKSVPQMMNFRKLFCLASAACVAVNCFAAVEPSPTYKLTQVIKLGGEGGWDYLSVDPAGGRLYISRGTHLMVVDTRTNAVVGDIPGTAGVHGAAVAPKHGMGFTSNGRDNTMTMFDLRTLKAVKQIPVGQRPDAIIYEPVSDRVFTFNAGTSDATAVDASTGAVVGSIPLGGKPEFPAVDGRGRLFVNIEDKNQIDELDPKTLKVTNTWSIAPCEEPSGLAIDAKHHLLFAVCSNQMMAVLDYKTGKLVASPKIGNGPDAAGFDPAFGTAFSSNGQDGTVDVVAKDSSGQWNVVQTVKTRKSARTMTLDPKTHKIYLVSADFLAPTTPPAAGQRQRRQMVPGSFTLLVLEPTKQN
jgi:DNA-binding beta-propeller fold protein YncE